MDLPACTIQPEFFSIFNDLVVEAWYVQELCCDISVFLLRCCFCLSRIAPIHLLINVLGGFIRFGSLMAEEYLSRNAWERDRLAKLSLFMRSLRNDAASSKLRSPVSRPTSPLSMTVIVIRKDAAVKSEAHGSAFVLEQGRVSFTVRAIRIH